MRKRVTSYSKESLEVINHPEQAYIITEQGKQQLKKQGGLKHWLQENLQLFKNK